MRNFGYLAILITSGAYFWKSIFDIVQCLFFDSDLANNLFKELLSGIFNKNTQLLRLQVYFENMNISDPLVLP